MTLPLVGAATRVTLRGLERRATFFAAADVALRKISMCSIKRRERFRVTGGILENCFLEMSS